MSSRLESLTIQEDAKEGVEDEEDLPAHPYERLKTTSTDPVSDIDVTRREVCSNQNQISFVSEKISMEEKIFTVLGLCYRLTFHLRSSRRNLV